MVSAQRLMKYATLESEENDHAREAFKRIGGSLEFKNVSMRYQEHLQPAIKNLSFEIK